MKTTKQMLAEKAREKKMLAKLPFQPKGYDVFDEDFPDDEFEEVSSLLLDSVCDVECPNPDCGEYYHIEQDADFKCHECGKGRISGLLVQAGMA